MPRAMTLIALLVLAASALAQPIEVPRIDTPPAIDAVLDDACWAGAAVLDDFTPPTSPRPRRPRPGCARTAPGST